VEKENLYKKIIQSWEVPSGKSQEEAWNEVNNRINQGRIVELPRRTNYLYWASAAAAVALLAFFLISPKSEVKMLEVATAMAQREHVVLPDGSEVELNAGSQLRFASQWNADRTVELQGEAFFKVKKGSSFTVKTTQGQVQVLGTSFNVLDRANKFDVECFTGKVGVSSGNEHVEITPGQHVSLFNGRFEYQEASGEHTWLTGQFVYNDEPLANVLDEVERQFNVRIKRPDLIGRKYTGVFTTKNLKEALDVICIPMGYKYSIDEYMNVSLEEIK
jgi:ferric-dicitrate binding protein FerR (iron transport regulator)